MTKFKTWLLLIRTHATNSATSLSPRQSQPSVHPHIATTLPAKHFSPCLPPELFKLRLASLLLARVMMTLCTFF